MRKKLINSIYILLLSNLILFSFLGCNKDNTTSPSKTNYWNHITFDISLENFITNAKSIDGRFICTTLQGLRVFNSLNEDSELVPVYGTAVGYDSKPVISDNFVVFSRENTTKDLIFSEYNSMSQDRNKYIYLGNLDAELEDFCLSNLNYDDELGCIKDSIFIVTIKGFDNINGTDVTVDKLLRINLNNMANTLGVFSDYKIIDIPYLQNKGFQMNAQYYYFYKDNYFLSYTCENDASCHTLIMNEESIVHDFKNPFGDNTFAIYFFEYMGYLFAHKSNYQLVFSFDGINWLDVGYMTPFMYNTCKVDNRLFMSFMDELYFIEVIENDLSTLEIYSLPCSELSGLTITSISYFNDSVVLTTSNGIFYKSVEDLLNDRIDLKNDEVKNLRRKIIKQKVKESYKKQ